MIPKLPKSAILIAAFAAPFALAVAAAPFPLHVLPGALGDAEDQLSLTESYCDARETVARTLDHDFAEAPRLAALTEGGMTMELWASDLLGTWTVVHHGGDGISCIVTSGQDWAAGADPGSILDGVLAETVHQS
jgi:hypothetical protein